MARIMDKIPYLNKRIVNRRSKAQGLIEFAFISLILFLLLFGILEMGRLMFIFSQISSAAQEGTRYGATHPLEIISAAADGLNTYPAIAHSDDPCNIVAQARARVVMLNPNDVGVVVGYDTGNPSPPYYPVSDDSANFVVGRDRVVVTTTYQFHFVVGILDTILPASGLTVQMVSARTVNNNETSVPPPGSCGYDPGAGYTPVPPGPTFTPAPPAPTPTATAVAAAPTPTPCTPRLQMDSVTFVQKQNSSTNWIGISVRVVDQAGNPISGLGNVQYQIYTQSGGSLLATGTLTSAGSGLYKFCNTGADYPTNPPPFIVVQTSNACTVNASATGTVSQSNNPSCP
jgi:Flp pilus assembly protein TadG